MKTIKINNIEVFKAIAFLNGMVDLPAKVSRARTKLAKSLESVANEYVASQKEIIVNRGGSFDDNGKVHGLDKENDLKAGEELRELALETTTISEVYDNQFNNLLKGFDDYNGEIKANDAQIFDALFDKLIVAGEQDEH